MRILLSDEIVASVRASIGEAFPGTKASHRAEALAAGFGFRNNAALLVYLASTPRHEVRAREVVTGAFQSRLGELSGAEIRDNGALAGAADAAGATIRTAGYDELSNSGREKFFGQSQVGDWRAPDMSNAERFAYMAFLLRWRMMNAGIANFVADYADIVPVHLHLAAACQANPNYDPEISAFLADWLVAAGEQEEAEWGDRIYEAMRFRINAYLNALCLAWDQAVDPMSLMPVGQPERPRIKGVPTISLSLAPGEPLSLFEAGQVEASYLDLTGLALMAHWRTGVSHAVLRQMTERLQQVSLGIGVPAGTRIVNGAGAVVSWSEARQLIRPSHALDPMAPGKGVDWDKLELLPTDRAGAAKAAELLEAGGLDYAVIPADDGFIAGLRSAARRHAYAVIVDMTGREVSEILPIMMSGIMVIATNLDVNQPGTLFQLRGCKVLSPDGVVFLAYGVPPELPPGHFDEAEAKPVLRASHFIKIGDRPSPRIIVDDEEPQDGLKPPGRG
ncbi:conserved hypothetical protein [Hyphomicrobiales bacterium]|jgi:hypothetical protein|nr:conserved hypothetical protein [Hyphomicrobiales bacterium]CAH1702954.1 conserved hypothetical protein [Hyphomicrobiales bacterium]CAI0347140.1 conserved hypothetical protein [Hyphomicrobiales bacterium]